MTEYFGLGEKDRIIGADAVIGDVRQFKKLQHLSNQDVAFRMATSVNEVKTYRKQFKQLGYSLSEVGIDYNTRLILGTEGISTTGHLFEQSDRALLAISGIGAKRLEHIREKLKEFFS